MVGESGVCDAVVCAVWRLVGASGSVIVIESVKGGVCCLVCLTILYPCPFCHLSVTGRRARRVLIKAQLDKLFVWYAGCRCVEVQ